MFQLNRYNTLADISPLHIAFITWEQKWKEIEPWIASLTSIASTYLLKSVFFNPDYEGIYHRSFLATRQAWVSTTLAALKAVGNTSDDDHSMKEIITLLTRMEACQSVSKYAIQKDVRRSIDRSRSSSLSSLTSSPRSPFIPGSPTSMNNYGFFSDQYSRFLFFEKHANEDIDSLMRIASDEQIGLVEMLSVLQIIEKAFGVKAHMCVKELVLQRVIQYIQLEDEKPESSHSDMTKKDVKREERTYESVFAFLYESCFELHTSEGGLLRDLITTLTHTLCTLSQDVFILTTTAENEEKKKKKKERLAFIAHGLLIILILLGINDPDPVTRLTAVIIHIHTNLILSPSSALTLSSPSPSTPTADTANVDAIEEEKVDSMGGQAEMRENMDSFDNLSLRHLADKLIHALENSSSSSITSLLHASEILLESQVLPSAFSMVLPSIAVKELSKYLQHNQSIISYYHRYSFYDSIALSLTNTIKSSSSSSNVNVNTNANSNSNSNTSNENENEDIKDIKDIKDISDSVEEKACDLNMIDIPMSNSSESIRLDLCEAMIRALIRLERYSEAYFYIYNPLLVSFYREL